MLGDSKEQRSATRIDLGSFWLSLVVHLFELYSTEGGGCPCNSYEVKKSQVSASQSSTLKGAARPKSRKLRRARRK